MGDFIWEPNVRRQYAADWTGYSFYVPAVLGRRADMTPRQARVVHEVLLLLLDERIAQLGNFMRVNECGNSLTRNSIDAAYQILIMNAKIDTETQTLTEQYYSLATDIGIANGFRCIQQYPYLYWAFANSRKGFDEFNGTVIHGFRGALDKTYERDVIGTIIRMAEFAIRGQVDHPDRARSTTVDEVDRIEGVQPAPRVAASTAGRAERAAPRKPRARPKAESAGGHNTIRALTNGRLPEDGPARVGTTHLPAGTRVSVDGVPVMWMTDAAVDDAAVVWAECVRQFEQTGLWPLLVPSSERLLDRISTPQVVPDVPVERTLRAHWDDEELGPMPPMATATPGGDQLEDLAGAGSHVPAPRAESAADNITAEVPAEAYASASRLALVAVQVPADVIAALGWLSGENGGITGNEISLALRSWESRFGTYLYELGADRFVLMALRPPMNLVQATALAAEVYAINSDLMEVEDTKDFTEYASLYLGSPTWYFWYD